MDCCNFAEQSGNERTTKSTVPITARYADTTMATTKKYLNHKQYGTLIQKCKDKISEFMLNTNYTSLAYEKCDYDPDREFWRLTVPTMGDILFRFNSYENDIALNRRGVEIVALPIIFKEYRNPAPFQACGLSFNNFNDKCVLMAMADATDKILTGVEKVIQIASNVASQPYYWLTEGTEVWWDDPEDETSGKYKVVKLPSDIDRGEWEDDTIVTISDGTSEAEVTLSEISPTLDL